MDRWRYVKVMQLDGDENEKESDKQSRSSGYAVGADKKTCPANHHDQCSWDERFHDVRHQNSFHFYLPSKHRNRN